MLKLTVKDLHNWYLHCIMKQTTDMKESYYLHILYFINKLKVDMLRMPLDMRIIPFLFQFVLCHSILSWFVKLLHYLEYILLT